jgi:hypothetical protein
VAFALCVTALFFRSNSAFIYGMTNKDREILEGHLAEIDRRRAELEMVLGTLPPDPYRCDRQDLEAELRGLWSLRAEIAAQLNPRPHAA